MRKNRRYFNSLRHSGVQITVSVLLIVAVYGAVFNALSSYFIKKDIQNAYFEGETLRISCYALDVLRKTNHISDPTELYYLDERPLHLTEGSIGQLNRLQLDAKRAGDLDFLSGIHEIKNLTFEHAEYLTTADFRNISKIGRIRHLTLNFDYHYLMANPKLDLQRISGNTDSISIVCRDRKKPQTDDLADYISYSLLKKNGFSDSQIPESIRKTEWWREISCLVELIRQHEKQCAGEDDKDLLTYETNVIYNQLSYDDTIKDRYSDDLSLANDAYEKINDYNDETLGSVLGQGEPRVGICCNFAAMEAAVLYELGISCIYAYGIVPSDDGRTAYHAWVLTWLRQNYYICDPTSMCVAEKGDSLMFSESGQIFKAEDFYSLDEDLKGEIEAGLFDKSWEKEDASYVEAIPFSGYHMSMDQYEEMQNLMRLAETMTFIFIEGGLVCILCLVSQGYFRSGNRALQKMEDIRA